MLNLWVVNVLGVNENKILIVSWKWNVVLLSLILCDLLWNYGCFKCYIDIDFSENNICIEMNLVLLYSVLNEYCFVLVIINFFCFSVVWIEI